MAELDVTLKMSDFTLNNLFSQFIREWLEEARAALNNSNSYTSNIASVYKKALDNLKKYPLPLSTASDAMKVNGIGKALVQKLEKRLSEYQAAEVQSSPSEITKEMLAAFQKKKSKLYPAERIVPLVSSQEKKRLPEDSGLIMAAKKKKTKAFVPAFRSGAFAILLTLLKGNSDLYMDKSEIIRNGQPYCDVSFEIPDFKAKTNSRFGYTAWSAMKSLCDKELVHKYGHPARYCLTDEGREIAIKLSKVTEANQLDPTSEYSSESDHASETKRSTAQLQTLSRSMLPIQDYRVTSDPRLATYQSNDIAANFSRFGRGWSKDMPPAFMTLQGSVNANEKSSMAEEQFFMTKNLGIVTSFPSAKEVGKQTNIQEPITIAPSTKRKVSPKCKSPSIIKTQCISDNEEDVSFIDMTESPNTPHIKEISTDEDRISSKLPLQTIHALNSSHHICLPKGSFDICIVLDNREVRGQKDRSYFQDCLQRSGLICLTRTLQLGDAMWIARPKTSTSTVDEIVLDIILERKTLDDLVSSIKDGRWKEQKFRLASCALPHVIYLVEENNFTEAKAFGLGSILSAHCNTQIDSGFFVKRTMHSEDTVHYLISLTRYLEIKYQNSDLYIIPTTCISKELLSSIQDYLKAEYETRKYFISFNTFQELNMKTKSNTINDIWIKQLLCTRGVSAEKGASIARHFSTARSLRLAYLNCDKKDRENLIKDKLNIPGRKGVQKALSKKISELFNAESYS